LPVTIIVYRNDALAFVELEMKAAGVPDFTTDLCNPDFEKIAQGAGLLGVKAETTGQVEPAIVQALAYDGPALVEVAVARQELSMPPTIP
jgi:pyruvate dehydrogenase (quinone)